jgi:hypothetical protein
MVLLAVLLTAATDEGGVRWDERVARVLPIVPICVALAAALTLAGPRRRVETFALEALGRSPLANAAGAAVGAGLVGLGLALLVLLDPGLSVHAFFPTLHASGPYVFDGGVFTNVTTGWRVSEDGTLSLPPAPGSIVAGVTAGLPPHGRLAAALVIALGSAAFALTVAQLPRTRRTGSLALLLATAALTTLCLQAAATGRLPALATPVPSTMLLLGTAWAIVRVRWDSTRR